MRKASELKGFRDLEMMIDLVRCFFRQTWLELTKTIFTWDIILALSRGLLRLGCVENLVRLGSVRSIDNLGDVLCEDVQRGRIVWWPVVWGRVINKRIDEVLRQSAKNSSSPKP